VQRTSAQHAIERKGTTHATVYGDRERIGQVITNLLTNAIKYSPNATSIVVTSASSQQDITLCVQDFGIGIAKDKQSQVFERFFRETGTREDTFTGLGLGLYVSAEIIQRQGGKIWVESEKGRGSTFCFTLPLQGSKDRRQQENGLAEEDMTHE
jgi:signal transduction histidine kinase